MRSRLGCYHFDMTEYEQGELDALSDINDHTLGLLTQKQRTDEIIFAVSNFLTSVLSYPEKVIQFSDKSSGYRQGYQKAMRRVNEHLEECKSSPVAADKAADQGSYLNP